MDNKDKEFQYILHQLKLMVDSLLSSTQKVQTLLDNDDSIEKYHLELEARFGILNNEVTDNSSGVFISSVKKEFFEHVLINLSSFEEWSSINDWKEYQDFFYTLPDNKKIRTTVSYIKNNQNNNHMIRTQHIIKNVLSKKTLLLNQNVSESNLCVRLSAAIEYQISEKILPDFITTDLVRIKKRKSFLYTPAGMNEPMWQFDLTISWTGKSKMECEIKQRTENPNYEIECECLSIKHYQNQKLILHQNKINNSNLYYSQILPNHSEYVIQSLLMKMFDFIIMLNPNEYKMNQLLQNIKLV